MQGRIESFFPISSVIPTPGRLLFANELWLGYQKGRRELRKHGVSFYEAGSVFFDPLAITYADPDHSIGELRFLTFGLSSEGLLLVVSHIEAADQIRIISARRATREEQKIYAEGN